ncbi:MAG: hypothetical protein J5J06_16805 [Phycisphaerae bacterium]|nr:hypothetical protein [Phycisphaerae bacterium]
MSPLDQRIRAAQRRLWLSRWLQLISFCVAIGGLTFAAFIAVQRGLEWAVSPAPVFGVVAGAALIASLIMLWVRRESRLEAAARLDEAAGLRERISTATYFDGADDPFARAVVVDAEKVSNALSVRRHLRLAVPRSLGWAGCSVLVALLAFLLPLGWLRSESAEAAADRQVEVQETNLQIRKKMDEIRKLADETPALAEFRDDLEKPEKPEASSPQTPSGIRHEAVKKIDRMEDLLKQKRTEAEQEGVQGLKKMLRRLNPPKSEEAATQKLAKSLQQGDFQAAKEELQKLREQLATLKSPEQRAAAEQMTKQIEEVAKQLEELSKNKSLEQKLTQAGVKEEDLKRMLENLRKEDIDQLKNQLEKEGWTQEQIEQMAQQLKEQQTAGAMAQKLAQALKSGAAGAGQSGDAMAGMSQAEQMLSDLEMAEMEMAQMEAALAQLQNARSQLGCKSCGGKGCSQCGGSDQGKGPGMGRKPGQGRGGIAPEEVTDVGFKIEKGKVHTGQGAIIGQTLVEGEQIAGEAAASPQEVIAAAERDASDRINRDRIPRQYHKAIREYFSTKPDAGQPATAPGPAQEPDSPTDNAGGSNPSGSQSSGPSTASPPK